MNPRNPGGPREGPEAPIKRAIKAALEREGWFVIVTHGNAFMSGLPDLYACHRAHGQRWIEVKNPAKFSFTKAQWDVFPKLAEQNVGVWVLTSATDHELGLLLKPPNFHRYLGCSKRTW